jgi:hypothetical protein
MALLFIDSFDHYQTAELPAKWTSGFVSFLGVAIVPGAGRCGSQALQVTSIGLGGVEKGVPFAGVTGILGFAYQSVIQLFNETTICHFAASGGAGVQIYLTRQVDGSLSAWRNEVVPVNLGTTAPDLIRQGIYYFIEVKVKIDGAVGTVEIRINGATVLLLSNVNTQSSLASGTPLSAIGITGRPSYTANIDDLYVADDAGGAPWNTFLGDVRVEYLRPDGAGAHQEWDLIGAASHWQAVDDGAIPDDDTSYIHTATIGLTDTETYLPTGLPAGTIFGLQVNLYARKTDSGPRSIAPVIRHAGVDHVGVGQQPSFSTYRYLIQIYMLNPGTAAAWTIADVNAVEAGVTVTV